MKLLSLWQDGVHQSTENDRFLKRHILSLLFVRVCLFTLLVSITTIFQAKGHDVILPPLPVTILFLLLITAYSAGSAALTGKSRIPLRTFGVYQLLSDVVFSALLVYGSGCSQSMFTPVFILPIIAGGLILYRMGGLVPATAATLLYGCILALEYIGLTPAYFHTTPYRPPDAPLAALNMFTVYGVTFFVTALISGKMAGRLRLTEKKLSKTVLEYDRLSILYKQIFDDISTGIITTNHQNLITSFNNAAERITGYSKSDVLGTGFYDRFPTIRLDSEGERRVCDLKKKDDTMIRVGFSFSHLNMPAQNKERKISRWKVVTLQDISKIEAMENQVREAEKMAAIGELSASIAHDFRNPLAAISGSAQVLAMDLESTDQSPDSATKTLVTIIQRESNRMAKTITDFLQFARPAEISGEWFDVKRLVDEVEEAVFSPQDALEGRTIEAEIEPRISGWGDRQQIQTVLTHLLENAIIMTGTAENRRIGVHARELEREGATYTCIEVCDSGPGIPEDLRQKVFKPFFSTREDGTGLGLAIVKQITENHLGITEIDSNATFPCIMRLLLPVPLPMTTPPHA